MLNNTLNRILKIYAHKYFIGPIVFTLIFITILFSPFNSASNFDFIINFFSYVMIVSALLLTVFTHHVLNNKRDLTDLFALTFISVIMSIITIIFFKTHSFWSYFALVSSIATAFVFFTIFKELINKIKI